MSNETSQRKQGQSTEQIIRIPLVELHPFPKHPYGIRKDQAMQDTMEQYVGDCAILVLNREFGFGPERLLRFNIALNAEMEKWWQVTAHPKKGDKESEIGYQRTKFDEALKAACGKNYRYDFAARYPWIDDGVI